MRFNEKYYNSKYSAADDVHTDRHYSCQSLTLIRTHLRPSLEQNENENETEQTATKFDSDKSLYFCVFINKFIGIFLSGFCPF